MKVSVTRAVTLDNCNSYMQYVKIIEKILWKAN